LKSYYIIQIDSKESIEQNFTMGPMHMQKHVEWFGIIQTFQSEIDALNANVEYVFHSDIKQAICFWFF